MQKTVKTPTHLIVEFHDNVNGTFDFRVKARNGRILFQSNQGFTRYEDCTYAWFRNMSILCGTDRLNAKYKTIFTHPKNKERYGSDK